LIGVPLKRFPLRGVTLLTLYVLRLATFLINPTLEVCIYNFFSLTRKIKASGASRQVEAMKHSPYDEDHEPVPGTNLHTTSGMLEKEL
jgi:hypothetical protein